MAHKDEEFLRYVVEAIVDEPDAVEIKRDVDEMGVLLQLKVAADDMGKVIGREGSTAKAIRTLLRVIGAQTNARVNLKILEPGDDYIEPGSGVDSSAQSSSNDEEEAAEAEEETEDDEEEEESLADSVASDLEDLDA